MVSKRRFGKYIFDVGYARIYRIAQQKSVAFAGAFLFYRLFLFSVRQNACKISTKV